MVFAIADAPRLLFSPGRPRRSSIGDAARATALPVFAERGTDFLTSRPVEQPGQGRRRPGPDRDGAPGVDRRAGRVPDRDPDRHLPRGVRADEPARRGSSTSTSGTSPGVPSVVYGLLGLAVFVAFFAAIGVGNGKNVLSGGLTLAVLILPLVIITSAEAIRAVPRGLRDSGFGLGASRWQVVRQLVLPSAAPGHPDRHGPGAVARARRDRAAHPGRAPSSARSRPAAAWPTCSTGPYAALPTIVFDWARKPQEEFRALTPRPPSSSCSP